MLAFSIVNGLKTWSAPNGELQLLKPAPHVIVWKFQGALFDVRFAKQAMDVIGQSVTLPQKLDIFHDWERMQLYATEARTLMTEGAIPLMPRLNSINVMISSHLVRMGVSMASFQVGGGIRMFSNREEFEQAIQQAAKDPKGADVKPG